MYHDLSLDAILILNEGNQEKCGTADLVGSGGEETVGTQEGDIENPE